MNSYNDSISLQYIIFCSVCINLCQYQFTFCSLFITFKCAFVFELTVNVNFTKLTHNKINIINFETLWILVPTVVPMIVDVSNVNESTCILTWDMIPDDREHVKGRVLGYTVRYFTLHCVCVSIHWLAYVCLWFGILVYNVYIYIFFLCYFGGQFCLLNHTQFLWSSSYWEVVLNVLTREPTVDMKVFVLTPGNTRYPTLGCELESVCTHAWQYALSHPWLWTWKCLYSRLAIRVIPPLVVNMKVFVLTPGNTRYPTLGCEH